MNPDVENAVFRVLEGFSSGQPPEGMTPEQFMQARDLIDCLKDPYDEILRLNYLTDSSLLSIAILLRCSETKCAQKWYRAVTKYSRLLLKAGLITDPQARPRAPRISRPRVNAKPLCIECPCCHNQVQLPKILPESLCCPGCGAKLVVQCDGGVPIVIVVDGPHHTEVGVDKPPTLEGAYQLLGGSPETSLRELKKSYREKIKAHHPDKVFHLGPELRTLAEKTSQKINVAWDLIQASHP